MEAEDCRRFHEALAAVIPPVSEMKMAPQPTEDGWCRVIDGPFAEGLKWQATETGAGFVADFRMERIEIEGLGRFGLSATLRRTREGHLRIDPFTLQRSNGDLIDLLAETGAFGDLGGGRLGALTLPLAELRIGGDDGLAGDVLAWFFRVDVRAARSNLTEARDQRNLMLRWLEDLPAGIGDAGSRLAFRDIVRAYPNARGVATLAARDDTPVDISGLLGAVLFGADFTEAEAVGLLEKAGLSLAWQPG